MTTIDITTPTGEDASNFTVNFNSPIRLQTDQNTQWMVALTQGTYTNGMRNIRAVWNNNIFQYSPDAGTTQKQIVIPDGYYQLKELDAYIRAQIAANGDLLPGDLNPIRLLMNKATIRVVLTVEAGYQVTWLPGGLGELLGFNAGVHDGEIAYEGDNPPDINRGTNKLYILCDLITNGSYRNGRQEPILFSTTRKGAPSAVIDIDPTTPKFRLMGRKGDINIESVNIRVVDERSRPVDFGGYPISLELYFKAMDLSREI